MAKKNASAFSAEILDDNVAPFRLDHPVYRDRVIEFDIPLVASLIVFQPIQGISTGRCWVLLEQKVSASRILGNMRR